MAGSTGITPGLLLGGDDFDLDQEIGTHELGNDEEHRCGPRVPEEPPTVRSKA